MGNWDYMFPPSAFLKWSFFSPTSESFYPGVHLVDPFLVKFPHQNTTELKQAALLEEGDNLLTAALRRILATVKPSRKVTANGKNHGLKIPHFSW